MSTIGDGGIEYTQVNMNVHIWTALKEIFMAFLLEKCHVLGIIGTYYSNLTHDEEEARFSGYNCRKSTQDGIGWCVYCCNSS